MHAERLLSSPFDESESVGVFVIRANQTRVNGIARQEALLLAAMMISQAALLALLLCGAVAVLISQPNIKLARNMRAMTPGSTERLDTPARHRRDEIGSLIGGANALLDANTRALQRERTLREGIEAMEAQYRRIFDSSSAGIFVLDEHGRLINSNPTVSKVVGMSLAAMGDLPRDDFIDRIFAQPERVRTMMQTAARTGETVSGDLELIQRGNARRWVHCLISVHHSLEACTQGQEQNTTEGLIYDITERKRTESAVQYQAEHDALTGLHNRAGSHAVIDRLIAGAVADGSALSVLCIDLDGFKQVNDEYGHEAGDQVLKVCAERMNAVVRRSTDLAGRLGGDEFVVALRDVGPLELTLSATAANLLSVLCEPVILSGGTAVRVGASIGIACAPRDGTDRATLIELADASMYEVKRTGKNNFAMAVAPAPCDRH